MSSGRGHLLADSISEQIATRPGPLKPKLVDQLRQAVRSRQYSRRAERTYCQWVRCFISFRTCDVPPR